MNNSILQIENYLNDSSSGSNHFQLGAVIKVAYDEVVWFTIYADLATL
ncbi:hypothetical protein J8281_12000 [Aquimarina sp. U1-2]|nr:hypothetical protein [Aquimarina sp. U1-2]MBP2832909.1 hypothetical protein [Aquimarina sp. U1-2]